MRPNGEVVAMIGGTDYQRSPFNRATQARRQPGSTFKLFVYLAALEHGWEPDDAISNLPIEQGSYRPKNYGESYSRASRSPTPSRSRATSPRCGCSARSATTA
jgi:penicillin-binding protein 1A